MRSVLRLSFVFVLSAATTVAVGADGKKEKEKPAPLPVTLKLIAKKKTCQLDLEGKTPEQFREAIEEAKKTFRYPKPPEVDLTLELTNTSDKDVAIWSTGDPVQVILDLKGKGAVSVSPAIAMTREFRVPQALMLPAGKSHTIPIKSLKYGMRGISQQAYWTDAGEYTLTARFMTGISPPPPDSKEVAGGFARITLTSNAVKLKVELKK